MRSRKWAPWQSVPVGTKTLSNRSAEPWSFHVRVLADDPANARCCTQYLAAVFSLAGVLQHAGRLADAEDAHRNGLEAARKFALRLPKSSATAQVQNSLAWHLATCADPVFRNGKRAVELATKVVEQEPMRATCWNTLGVAHYRCGDWKAALAALEKSMELRNGGESEDWFFVAMAHWQLDDKPKAITWYDKALGWMEKNQPKDKELIRFRARRRR